MIYIGENTINDIPHYNEIKQYLDLLVLQKNLTGKIRYSLKRKIEFLKLKIKYNFECANCKKQEPEIVFERDHIIPLKQRGLNSFDNLQLLCRLCNLKKGNKKIDYRHPLRFGEPILKMKIKIRKKRASYA